MTLLNSDFFLAIFGPIVVGAVSYFFWRLKQQRAVPKYFQQSAEIHDILNDLISDTQANRILILKSHNGGGIPSPERVIKSSCLYEVVGSGIQPVKADWQNQILDKQYLGILAKIQDSKQWLRTSEMSEGMLRDVYIAGGIKSAVVGRIGHSPTALFYISLNFTCDLLEANIPVLRNSIRIAVAKLREFF